MLQLVSDQGETLEAVPLCQIASVELTGVAYDAGFTYLPDPSPAPVGCGADCIRAIRAYLPVGTTGVVIRGGGQILGQGTVRENVSGMLVLVGENNEQPTFVSACKAEVLVK